MIPHQEGKKQINPRELVEAEGADALWDLLAGVGYIPQEDVFNDFLKALLNFLPWRVTGIRGGGKSAFPAALAKCCNLDSWGLTGKEGIKPEELLYHWDKDEQREWMNEARQRNIDFDTAYEQKWMRKYLVLGEVLGAYDAAATATCPPLLFLDELDKLSHGQQDLLLQPLADGVMFIPRLRPSGVVGCPELEKRPIVISASNEKIHSAPLRSRHIFTKIETPDNKKEVEILLKHVPQTSPFLLKVVVKILDAVRTVPGLDDPPALRESIHLLKALNRDRVTQISQGFLRSYLCFLAKEAEDRDYLLEQLDYVEQCACAPYQELEMWVDFVINERDGVEVGV